MDQGIINLNVDDQAAGPAIMSEFEVNEHALGVILINQYEYLTTMRPNHYFVSLLDEVLVPT